MSRVIAKVGRTPLSAKLKSARLQARLTQQELAKRVHCSRTAIADYERGRSEPDPERLAAIAKATNVPLSYFLDAPTLLDGEPVQVLTPAQLLDIQRSRPGPPRSGGWTMVRPEHWCDRLGAIVWVEVEQGSALAQQYEPGTVLAVAHTNLIHGCRVIVAVDDGLAVGELIEDDGRWRIMTPSGDLLLPAGRHLIGSVVARIEPAAAAILSQKPRPRKPSKTKRGGRTSSRPAAKASEQQALPSPNSNEPAQPPAQPAEETPTPEAPMARAHRMPAAPKPAPRTKTKATQKSTTASE